MNFKPFFIHRFSNSKEIKSGIRGMTVHLQPSTANPREVLVRMAFCQHRDMYCKKTGRFNTLANPPVVFTCNARQVVKEINRILNDRPSNDGWNEVWYGVGDWVFKYLM